AVVDCRVTELSAGSTLSDAGVDVSDPAGAVRGGEGARLLPGSCLSDADGDGRGHGRALDRVTVEDTAARGRGCVLHRACRWACIHGCDCSSPGAEWEADEVRA